MQMDGWTDHLHFGLFGEHVLFSGLHLDSWRHFIEACILTVVICASERFLTYAMSKSWSPFQWTQRSRFRKALWKAMLYWAVTLLRLIYMLVAMTFSMWLIIVTVTTLSAGQFIIEYLDTPDYGSQQDPERVKEPLLASSPTAYETTFALHPYGSHEHANDHPFRLSSSTNSTSSLPSAHNSRDNLPNQSTSAHAPNKGRPEDIFIHPMENNLARADAAAMSLGLGGDTDLVQGSMLPPEGETAWEVGKGRDVAREIMGLQKMH